MSASFWKSLKFRLNFARKGNHYKQTNTFFQWTLFEGKKTVFPEIMHTYLNCGFISVSQYMWLICIVYFPKYSFDKQCLLNTQHFKHSTYLIMYFLCINAKLILRNLVPLCVGFTSIQTVQQFRSKMKFKARTYMKLNTI